MKKLSFLSFAAVLFLIGFSAGAQTQGEIRAGVGLVLGTSAAIDAGGNKAGVGINIGGEYLITDIISVAPSYTFFFGSDYEITEPLSGTSSTTSFRSGVFNLDGRYYFDQFDFQLYGLFGFAFFNSTTETEVDSPLFPVPSTEISDSEVGVNIGGGIFYPLNDDFLLNGQLKFQSAGDGQLAISAGLVYVISN